MSKTVYKKKLIPKILYFFRESWTFVRITLFEKNIFSRNQKFYFQKIVIELKPLF